MKNWFKDRRRLESWFWRQVLSVGQHAGGLSSLLRHTLLPLIHFMHPVTWIEREGVYHFDIICLHFHAWTITVEA